MKHIAAICLCGRVMVGICMFGSAYYYLEVTHMDSEEPYLEKTIHDLP